MEEKCSENARILRTKKKKIPANPTRTFQQRYGIITLEPFNRGCTKRWNFVQHWGDFRDVSRGFKCDSEEVSDATNLFSHFSF